MTKLTKLTFITVFLLLAGTSFSFQRDNRDVDSFDEIALSTHADLYLKIGSKYSVVLDGDEEDLEDIVTEVSNGRLRIKNRDRGRWGSWNSRVRVYITMPRVKGLYVSGSGDIIGESKIESGNLDLSVSGSGDIELDVSSDVLELTISGSGDADLSGDTNEFKARISGSGTIRADDLTAKKASIRISGSGSTSIDVTDDLEVTISGSGSVDYTGDPGNVNAHSSGSGKVRKRN